MSERNLAFDPKAHMQLVTSHAFDGKALCVFCGSVKAYRQFPLQHVSVWKQTTNPHRAGKCLTCDGQPDRDEPDVSLDGLFSSPEFDELNRALDVECERAMRQRDTYKATDVSTAGHGGSHDTCFGFILRTHFKKLLAVINKGQ